MDCTYGETERNWQGRQRYVRRNPIESRLEKADDTTCFCRSYGPLSDLNQRLHRLESNLLAKLGEAGLPATQLTSTLSASTTADAMIGFYSNDKVAELSAAFEFATSFLPADPGNSTAYRVGFTGASTGRAYLSRKITGLSNLTNVPAAVPDHRVEAAPSPAPSKLVRRRSSLASSVSTVPSDTTEPQTPPPPPSSAHLTGLPSPACGWDAGRHSFVQSPLPLSHKLTEPPEAQHCAPFPKPSLDIYGASPGAISDAERGLPESRTLPSGQTPPPPFGTWATHPQPLDRVLDLARFELSPSIPCASPACAQAIASGLSQPSLFSF